MRLNLQKLKGDLSLTLCSFKSKLSYNKNFSDRLKLMRQSVLCR